MEKTLIIMGTHPNGQKTFDWNRKDCEIWMFNEAPNFKKEDGSKLFPRCDAVFQLHHEAIWKNPKNRSDPGHYDWLKSGNTPKVYMQEKYPEIPKSEKYPIERVLALTENTEVVINGKKKKFKYFTSSPDLAFALAADMWKRGIKYKQIEVHGIELEMVSEYQYQRTGFGFWIGYLTALGAKVVIYNSIFNAPMYGYEGDVIIPPQQFQKRLDELTAELGNDIERYQKEAKEFLEGISELLKKDVSKSIEKGLNEFVKSNEKGAILNGRIKENIRCLEKAKAMEEATGTSVFSVGDFDSPKGSFSRQLVQVRSDAFNLNAQINLVLKRLLNLKKGSQKRQKTLDEFGTMLAELLNKNMLIAQIVGAIKETEYYIDLIKLSYQKFEND